MRRILLSIALAASVSACSHHPLDAHEWLRQRTVDEVEIDHMRIAVSWLRVEKDHYDVHVSRAYPPAATVEPSKLPGEVARKAAARIMENRCRGAELYGDTALPQPTFSFRAVCPR